MENKLQVRNLRISFRTSNGKVQAVRGIDFELAEGETLAIVGESGSGKSVTSRAILGISAGNAIVESGEIIYDGQDLLKISEEDFHKIRGDKIAMIFQDPMSSLDPIVKIGRQLTEAMILKGKIRQRQSRKTFNAYLKNMSEAMAQSAESPADAEKAGVMCKTFDKFEFKHVELESGYNYAHEAACEAAEDIDKISFEFEKGSVGKDAADRINDIVRQSRESINAYVVPETKKDEIFELTDSMKKNFAHKDYMASVADMKKIRAILGEAIAKKAPNFFRLGYYLTFSDQPVPEMGVDELDAFMKEYLDKNFMLEFIADATRALKYSEERCQNNIKKAVEELKASAPVFAKDTLDKKECYETLKALEATVKSTIDPLAVSKDSLIYTFPSSMKSEIDKYFKDSKSNVRIMNKYEREKRRYDALIAKGKKPGFELAEAAVTNLDLIKSNVKHLIDRLVAHYNEILAENAERSYEKDALRCIDYLVENASGVTKKVTRQIAKHKAIKLMEEVGISEPHKRYNQYPFEFSGGMRQRIVIAIALAADLTDLVSALKLEGLGLHEGEGGAQIPTCVVGVGGSADVGVPNVSLDLVGNLGPLLAIEDVGDNVAVGVMLEEGVGAVAHEDGALVAVHIVDESEARVELVLVIADTGLGNTPGVGGLDGTPGLGEAHVDAVLAGAVIPTGHGDHDGGELLAGGGIEPLVITGLGLVVVVLHEAHVVLHHGLGVLLGAVEPGLGDKALLGHVVHALELLVGLDLHTGVVKLAVGSLGPSFLHFTQIQLFEDMVVLMRELCHLSVGGSEGVDFIGRADRMPFGNYFVACHGY